MKRSAAIFLRLTLTLVSLAALVVSGWLWHRSRSVSDLYYRYEPTADGGSAMRGGASMKGALVFGSIVDASRSCEVSGYRHDALPVMKASVGSSGGGSMLQAVPEYQVAALGFGVSQGELKVNVPLAAFFLPKRTYHAVYIPYYFIMLLAAIQPMRVAWKFYRGKKPFFTRRETRMPVMGLAADGAV